MSAYRTLRYGQSIEKIMAEPALCHLRESDDWIELVAGVDGIAGYDMLEFIELAAEGEEVIGDWGVEYETDSEEF